MEPTPTPDGVAPEEEHAFLRYAAPKRGRRVVRDLAFQLMNQLFGENFTRTKWLKIKPSRVRCFERSRDGSDNKEWWSNPFTLSDLENHLDAGQFDPKAFNVFDPSSDWLDDGIDFAHDVHVCDPNGDVLKVQLPLNLGPTFPLLPALDREGWMVSSFQRLSHARIFRLHQDIVKGSAGFLDLRWLEDLRALICECVSLIDMLLHQLYLKAEFDPLTGWKFDRAKLGERQGRRLHDKLAWVGAITGRPLDDARDELAALDLLRTVRNHVQHFDPPSFACTLEGDAVRWLNATSPIARLAWKIRTRIGAPLTKELIALVLLPEVTFAPKYPSFPRAPIQETGGYATTCWPKREPA